MGVGILKENTLDLQYLAGVFVAMIFFVLQPFLTFAFVAIMGLARSNKFPWLIYLVAIFGSCYLGLINATKLPDSDYFGYLEMFYFAQESSIYEFLTGIDREQLYYVFLYAIANVPYANASFFVFTSTLVSYLFLVVAVVRTSIALGLRFQAMVGFVVIVMLFPPLFSYSAHLMRQFLAGSIVVLYISSNILSGKKQWLLLMAAILCHYSAIIFVLVALIKKFDGLSTSKSVGIYIVLGSFGYFLLGGASILFADTPVIGFVLERTARGEGAELNHLSLVSIFFALFLVMISIKNIYISKRIRSLIPTRRDLSVSVGIILFTCIALIGNMQEGSTEIATRIFIFIYILAGLAVPLYFASNSRALIFITPILALLVPFFFYKTQFGEWQYASIAELLFMTSWQLLNYRII